MSFQITYRDEHIGARHTAVVDHLLDVEVGVRLERARCACGSHARRQIQPREAHSVLDVERHSGAGRIEQMLMHADQAGNHGVIAEIHPASAGRRLYAIRRTHALDTSMIDDDGLIFYGRRAGTIDHPHVLQRNHRIVDGDERLQARRKDLLPASRQRGGDDQRKNSFRHTMEQAV